jgi:hypothetical protein
VTLAAMHPVCSASRSTLSQRNPCSVPTRCADQARTRQQASRQPPQGATAA